MYVVCAVCIPLGLWLVVTSLQQHPGDAAVADAFRRDAGCGTDLPSGPAAGACRVQDAVIDEATEFHLGSVRRKHDDDVVVLRAGDRVRRRVHLSDADGPAFVHGVARGTPARVQLFHGTIVRLAANGMTAETRAAPDVVASSNGQMPWVGGGIAAAGAVFGLAATSLFRRGGAPALARGRGGPGS
jgi:hypothetical protein